jgi:hypothetical protein
LIEWIAITGTVSACRLGVGFEMAPAGSDRTAQHLCSALRRVEPRYQILVRKWAVPCATFPNVAEDCAVP